MTENQSRLSMDLPCLLFATRHEMDDYCAPDMLYGDLSAEVLRQQYHLHDISAHLNPFTHPNREESARILFDEFRYLADTFAFWGPYKGLARTMITHMQDGNGTVFSDPLLDQAMAEHISMKRSIRTILSTLQTYIDWNRRILPKQVIYDLKESIMGSYLPRFDNFKDRINGLGITVHDTWATHIIIESLHIENSRYHARVKYRIQDHFGLDAYDILKGKFHLFRFFRIWFVLQRYYRFGFKPFITNMEAIIEIYGDRKS
ncbi:MAG: YPO3983 family protein [Mixta calida]|nr:YPO3983 family protein [Mixta calida]